VATNGVKRLALSAMTAGAISVIGYQQTFRPMWIYVRFRGSSGHKTGLLRMSTVDPKLSLIVIDFAVHATELTFRCRALDCVISVIEYCSRSNPYNWERPQA